MRNLISKSLIIACMVFSSCSPGSNLLTKPNDKRPWRGDVPSAQAAIARQLTEGKHVALTVALVCTSTFTDDYYNYWKVNRAEWTKSCISSRQSLVEEKILNAFGGKPGFSMIERTSLDKIYDELALSAKPEISDETRLKIGKLSNATHILLISLTRSESGEDTLDLIQSRLIEIESGQLLASQPLMHTFRSK